MTTPPVPQWAVDAAKALHREQWHVLTYDAMVMQGARIIAAHAPQGQAEARLAKLLRTIDDIAAWTDHPATASALYAAIDASRKSK